MEAIKAEEPREGDDGTASDSEEVEEESEDEAPSDREGPHASVEVEGTSTQPPEEENSRSASRASSRFSQLSRSPPRSRSPSPDTLAKMTTAMSLHGSGMREKVATDLAKRARQQRKYHTKRGAQRAGRPHGSKAKQDQRVKMDKDGFW